MFNQCVMGQVVHHTHLHVRIVWHGILPWLREDYTTKLDLLGPTEGNVFSDTYAKVCFAEMLCIAPCVYVGTVAWAVGG